MEFIANLQELLDVCHTVVLDDHAPDPEEEVAASDSSDHHKPEPKEDEDFLVEEVDGQHALDGPPLQVL